MRCLGKFRWKSWFIKTLTQDGASPFQITMNTNPFWWVNFKHCLRRKCSWWLKYNSYKNHQPPVLGTNITNITRPIRHTYLDIITSKNLHISSCTMYLCTYVQYRRYRNWIVNNIQHVQNQSSTILSLKYTYRYNRYGYIQIWIQFIGFQIIGQGKVRMVP